MPYAGVRQAIDTQRHLHAANELEETVSGTFRPLGCLPAPSLRCEMMDRIRPAIPWALGGLLLFVVFSAIRIGVADLLSQNVRKEIAAWSSLKHGPGVVSLTETSRHLAIERLLSPEDPDVFEDVARVAFMRSRVPGTSAADAKGALVEGLVAIRRAIALRPVSPYGWAILLRVKEGLGEYDAEFHRAFHGAAMLGPGEPELRVIVVDVGLKAWPVLSAAEQTIVMGSVLHGMKRQEATISASMQVQHGDCPEASRGSGCAR